MDHDRGADHVDRTGSFLLPVPPATAFPFFTAEGERRWVPEWEPIYLHPPHPSNAEGTVFRTDHGNEETFWLVLAYSPAEGVVTYGRFTPGSRLGTVHVRCSEEAEASTRVTVSYSLTALSIQGRSVLEAMSPESFRATLDEWRVLVMKCLDDPAGRPTGGSGE